MVQNTLDQMFSSLIEALGHMVSLFYFIMETLLALELMFVCLDDE
jgi:hypothetical protein